MNHSLQTLKQLGILDYATIFIKDGETTPPPYELSHLRKFTLYRPSGRIRPIILNLL